MKKIFISQPMNGKTDEEIVAERNKIIDKAHDYFKEPIYVINSLFDENNPLTLITNDFNGLGYLGMSLILLSKADIVFFAKDWDNYRGCKIEHKCCIEYGIPIVD